MPRRKSVASRRKRIEDADYIPDAETLKFCAGFCQLNAQQLAGLGNIVQGERQFVAIGAVRACERLAKALLDILARVEAGEWPPKEGDKPPEQEQSPLIITP